MEGTFTGLSQGPPVTELNLSGCFCGRANPPTFPGLEMQRRECSPYLWRWVGDSSWPTRAVTGSGLETGSSQLMKRNLRTTTETSPALLPPALPDTGLSRGAIPVPKGSLRIEPAEPRTEARSRDRTLSPPLVVHQGGTTSKGLILHVRKLMLREVKSLAQGHTGLGVEFWPVWLQSPCSCPLHQRCLYILQRASLGLSFPLYTGGWGSDAQGLRGLM